MIISKNEEMKMNNENPYEDYLKKIEKKNILNSLKKLKKKKKK